MYNDPRYATFETPFGTGGIAWTEAGIFRAALPEADGSAVARRLTRGLPSLRQCAPDEIAGPAIAALQTHLSTGAEDLTPYPLDLRAVPDFDRQVLEICARVPPGDLTTYGDIAREIGGVGLSRAVGQALGANPVPPFVPCHRVHGADGKLGGFSAAGGRDLKRKLLALEGAAPGGQPDLFGHTGDHPAA